MASGDAHYDAADCRRGILIAALLAQIPTFRVLGRMDVATVVRER